MALSKFPWLRSFVRRNTNQIPEERAQLWKQRLSIAYMLLAWNTLGLVGYQVYKGKGDWAKEYKTEEERTARPAQQWAKTLGIKNAKVVKITGFDVQTYEIHEADDDDLSNLKQ